MSEKVRSMMMKTQAITKFISELDKNTSYEGRLKIKYALASTLPDTAFMRFIENEGFPEIYDNSITRRGLKNRFSCRQRIAIKKEIEELLSPQCKRKTVLRDNLKSRYKYAFPKDQEKVLRSMLFQPSVKERQWAFSKLSASWNNWGKLFEKDVIDIFEKYKDEACAILIVKCLPASYVYENREELAAKVGWRRVMVATGKDYPDVIDLSKLNTDEAVRTIVNLKLSEHRKLIEDILYTSILREIEYIVSAGKIADNGRLAASEGKFYNHHLVPKEERDIIYSEPEWGDTGKAYLTYYFGIQPPNSYYCHVRTISLREIGGVSLALWAMGRLGMAEEIVQFSKYDMDTEEILEYNKRDCQDLPVKIEDWLFKAYNYILTSIYGEQPLSDEELRSRFVGQSSDNGEIQPIEVPEALSEQAKLLEEIGFVPTRIDDDVPF